MARAEMIISMGTYISSGLKGNRVIGTEYQVSPEKTICVTVVGGWRRSAFAF
jgi:hypothetical protein